MSMTSLSKPIVILGAARSGTKMLGRMFKKHPDLAYWPEPNYVWKRSNGWVGHDMLPAALATPDIIYQIREIFLEYTKAQGKTRFCEKTPANTLRLPFILKVLPDAKLIHILRDGRDVALSARHSVQGRKSKASALEMAQRGKNIENINLFEQLSRASKERIQQLSRRDIPYYIPHFLSTILYRTGLKRTPAIWGPRFPGIQDVFKLYSLIEVCAIQWRWCVESVMNCIEAYQGNVDYFEIKYEELCAQPEIHLKRIYEFAELSCPDNLAGIVQNVESRNSYKWKQQLDRTELDLIKVHISHTLKQLGYEV